MRIRTTAEGLIAHDPQRDRWVRLPGEHDLLAFLAAGDAARRRAEAAIAADDAVEADPGTRRCCRSARARSARSCCGSRT